MAEISHQHENPEEKKKKLLAELAEHSAKICLISLSDIEDVDPSSPIPPKPPQISFNDPENIAAMKDWLAAGLENAEEKLGPLSAEEKNYFREEFTDWIAFAGPKNKA